MRSEIKARFQGRGTNGLLKIETPDIPVEWFTHVTLEGKGTHEGARKKQMSLSFETTEMINWLRHTANELELAQRKQIRAQKSL